MQLRRLTGLEQDKIKAEYDELKQKIASEVKASVEIYQIAKKYNVDVATVRIISKKMKGECW